MDCIAEKFKAQNGFELKRDPMTNQRLKEAGEKAKIELSSVMSTDINLTFKKINPILIICLSAILGIVCGYI